MNRSIHLTVVALALFAGACHAEEKAKPVNTAPIAAKDLSKLNKDELAKHLDPGLTTFASWAVLSAHSPTSIGTTMPRGSTWM